MRIAATARPVLFCGRVTRGHSCRECGLPALLRHELQQL